MPKKRKTEKHRTAAKEFADFKSPIKTTIKRLTETEVAEAVFLIIDQDKDGLERIRDSKKHSSLEVWIASIALKGIQKGDMSGLDGLLNRAIGKVKDKVELTGKDGGAIDIHSMSAEERKAQLAAFRKMRELAGND